MIIDPSRIPDMQVCRACRDIVGPFRPLHGRSRDQGRVTVVVRDWSHEVVARNLSTIDMDDRSQVPVGAYCREARLRVEPMDRFREMCVYLDERGRAELDEPTRKGR